MRNYKNETKWRAESYTRLEASVNKELAQEFKSKLASEKLTFAAWLKARINEYLGGE